MPKFSSFNECKISFLFLNEKHNEIISLSLKTLLNILIILKISIENQFFSYTLSLLIPVLFPLFFLITVLLSSKTPKHLENLSLLQNIAILLIYSEFYIISLEKPEITEKVMCANELVLLCFLIINENLSNFFKRLLQLSSFFLYLQFRILQYHSIDIALIVFAMLIMLYHLYFQSIILTKQQEILTKQQEISSENDEYLLLFDTISRHFPSNLFSFFVKDLKASNSSLFQLNFANESARNLFNLIDNMSLNTLLENINLNSDDILDGIYCPTLKKDNLLKNLLETIDDERIFSQTIKKNLDKTPNIKKFLTCSYDLFEKNEHLKKKYRVFLIKFYHKNRVYFIVNMEDMHLEEEIVHLKEMDKFKDEMLASITHDLRSPLSSVLKWIEFAKNTENIEESHKNLDLAENNGNLLMNLINDILDFSSMKNGKFKLNYSGFPLNILFEDILNMMRIQADVKEIHIEVQNNCPKNLIIFSDILRIKQVIYNLIGNSLKFTSKNGRILLKSKLISNRNLIKFSVIDNGTGIKPEILPRLCKAFHSYDYNGVYNKQGIGLGLHICTMIVSQLGPFDHLKIKSKFNEGSSFSFYLYLSKDLKKNKMKTADNIVEIEANQLKYAIQKQSEDFLKELSNFHSNSKELPSENNEELLEIDDLVKKKVPYSQHYTNSFKNSMEKEKIVEKNLEERIIAKIVNRRMGLSDYGHRNSIDFDEEFVKEIRILLVDDNGFNIMILQKFLADFNKKYKKYRISNKIAYNGLEAVELFKKMNFPDSKEFFHAILMDGVMPLQNGFVACEEIRKNIKELGYIGCKVIGCTGLTDLSQGFECGMDKILRKPIERDKLFEELMKICIYEEKR